MHGDSGQNGHLFSSGNSSFPIGFVFYFLFFCLLVLVLFHMMVEHFKLKKTNGKWTGSDSCDSLPLDRVPHQLRVKPQCKYVNPFME